jgi:hypothetical protein
VIIRILGDGQYNIDSYILDDLNTIDNRIVDHISKGDRKAYKEDLSRMIARIKENGEPLDPTFLEASDIIVPPKDLSFEEARIIFSGRGLIEG